MSKSRRAAADALASARPGKTKWTARGGWLLAASLLCCALVTLALRLGLYAGFAALFRAWGVDAEIVRRAPAWARLVYRWHGSLVTLAASLALLALSRALRRLWLADARTQAFQAGRFARGTLAGIGLSAAILVLSLVPDSVRALWPLTKPRATAALIPLCAISLVSVLAEEAFTKQLVYDGLCARWGRGWAAVACCTLFFIMNGGYSGNVPCGANVLLLGLLCCALYARRGLWPAVGLRWGWSLATMLLFGYSGGEAAVYRFYGISENWLTGGDAGPLYGLWMTLALLAALAWLERDRLPKAKHDRMS